MEHAPEPVANFVDKLWMFAYFVIHRRFYPQKDCITCMYVMNMHPPTLMDSGFAKRAGMNMQRSYPQREGNTEGKSSTVSTELSTGWGTYPHLCTAGRGGNGGIVRLFLRQGYKKADSLAAVRGRIR